jgi:hypothetical protein
MASPKPSELVSRREAARLLGCTSVTVDKIAARNGLRMRQIPGHNRKFLFRAELDALLAAAVGGAENRMEARA